MGAFSELELKLIGCVGALALIFGLYLYVEHRGAEKCELRDAQIAAIQNAAARQQEAKDASRVKDAEDQYHAEVAKNVPSVAIPEPVIRLCVSPSTDGLPQAATHPSGSPGPSTASRTLPPVAGPNIAGRLYAEADRADKLAAQLRALQLACQGDTP